MASHSSTVKYTIHLPKSPHQPKGFSFPKRNVGATKWSFKEEWFNTWSWLHYNEGSDCVLCHFCCQAIKLNLMSFKTGSSDAAFVSENLVSINCCYFNSFI